MSWKCHQCYHSLFPNCFRDLVDPNKQTDPEELDGLLVKFEDIDVDRDGMISTGDLNTAMKRMGYGDVRAVIFFFCLLSIGRILSEW